MKASELKKLYVDFFKERGHKESPNVSLIPENDASVLFTTAGMHPLVPYLLGEKHPLGKRLVSCQRCLRTGDIDEVGDDFHLTFFEMLGNWSLGDYFKKESIEMSFEFLTEVLKLDKDRLAVTVFEGDNEVAYDLESEKAWLEVGIPKSRIFAAGRKENWWGPAGMNGPCGPDTEIFYDLGLSTCSNNCHPNCECGRYVEIWNNVFMEYNKISENEYVPLTQKNVDTGLGFERVLAILNNKKSIYETELFWDMILLLEKLSEKKYESYQKEFRVIIDHIRTAVFVLGDERGVVPSNVDQGYVLRRIIRRTIRYLKQLEVDGNVIDQIASLVISLYRDDYPILEKKKDFILDNLAKETKAFEKTIRHGFKEFAKIIEKDVSLISGIDAFRLYDTYGFPIEFTEELANEKNILVDIEGFHEKYREHQEKSRMGAEKKFKGGLADATIETTRLHTATHLLQKALQEVLNAEAEQRGANITAERLRFDFSFDRKLTDEEVAQVEKIVNDIIKQKILVEKIETTLDEAKKMGAIGLFEKKYGEKVIVHKISDFSIEMCGGPHVNNTSELGRFKIIKQDSVSMGVRRIKAVLE